MNKLGYAWDSRGSCESAFLCLIALDIWTKTLKYACTSHHRKMPECLTSLRKNRVHNKALNKEQEIIVTFYHKIIKIVTP